MAENTDLFILTDQEYNRGILLNEYKGKLSLVSAELGGDGNLYKRWCFAQTYDKDSRERKPGKSIPVMLDLGTREEAVKHLTALLDLVDPDGTLRVPF